MEIANAALLLFSGVLWMRMCLRLKWRKTFQSHMRKSKIFKRKSISFSCRWLFHNWKRHKRVLPLQVTKWKYEWTICLNLLFKYRNHFKLDLIVSFVHSLSTTMAPVVTAVWGVTALMSTTSASPRQVTAMVIYGRTRTENRWDITVKYHARSSFTNCSASVTLPETLCVSCMCVCGFVCVCVCRWLCSRSVLTWTEQKLGADKLSQIPAKNILVLAKLPQVKQSSKKILKYKTDS